MDLKQFLKETYKHDRLYGRGQEYGDLIVSRCQEDLDKKGYSSISRHESKKGEAVWFVERGGQIEVVEDEAKIQALLKGYK